MESKKHSLSTFQIILIILLAGILSIGLFVGGYLIINQSNNNKVNNEVAVVPEKEIVENKITNTEVVENLIKSNNIDKSSENKLEISKYELQKSDRFTISKVEEDADGYTLYIHVLDDKVKIISQEEYNNVLNGGTIKFRGNTYKKTNKGKYSGLGSSEGIFIQKENDKSEYSGLAISKYYNSETGASSDKYAVWNVAGKEKMICDYKTDQITKIKVDKNVQCGDTFTNFLLNEVESKLVVKDYNNNFINEKEDEIREFLMKFDPLDTESSYGECVAYILNDKIVAIQTFRSSAP